ncbi:MAG TPA: PilZ domain-containing protein [Geothrix sp.]
MAGNLIRNPEAIAEIVGRACGQHELMILVTPYLRFESSFLKLDGNEIHAAATMGREEAQYGLRNAGLRLRFPHGVSFLEGPTQLRGFGMVDGRWTIRLALPGSLQDDDQRRAYRVDRVGRVAVTFSTPGLDLIEGTLVDISATGVRIFSPQGLGVGGLGPGDDVAVTIPLIEGVRINTPAKVRHVQGRVFGVEYLPPLEREVLEPLSRWVFERREEDLDRLVRRGPGSAPQGGGVRSPAGVPSGLLLVSQDAALELVLQDLLGGMQPLQRLPSTVPALKDALARNPALLLFHVPNLGLDERRRLRTMVELVQGRVPFILLGTGVDGGALLELGSELKATVSIVFNPDRATFFQRLVLGVLRRTYEGGESPMVPLEPGVT